MKFSFSSAAAGPPDDRRRQAGQRASGEGIPIGGEQRQRRRSKRVSFAPAHFGRSPVEVAAGLKKSLSIQIKFPKKHFVYLSAKNR